MEPFHYAIPCWEVCTLKAQVDAPAFCDFSEYTPAEYHTTVDK